MRMRLKEAAEGTRIPSKTPRTVPTEKKATLSVATAARLPLKASVVRTRTRDRIRERAAAEALRREASDKRRLQTAARAARAYQILADEVAQLRLAGQAKQMAHIRATQDRLRRREEAEQEEHRREAAAEDQARRLAELGGPNDPANALKELFHQVVKKGEEME